MNMLEGSYSNVTIGNVSYLRSYNFLNNTVCTQPKEAASKEIPRALYEKAGWSDGALLVQLAGGSGLSENYGQRINKVANIKLRKFGEIDHKFLTK